MKMLSVNVRSILRSSRRAAILREITSTPFDVAFLQECFLPSRASYPDLTKDWPGPSHFSGSNACKNDGIAVLFSQKLPWVIKSALDLVPGRLCVLDVDLYDLCFRFINVYFPQNPRERIVCMKKIELWLCTQRFIVLGGDFNLVVDSPDRDSSCLAAKQMLLAFDLRDSFREVHLSDPGHTWAGHGFYAQSRIDYLFIYFEIFWDSRFSEDLEFFLGSSWYHVRSFITNQQSVGRKSLERKYYIV